MRTELKRYAERYPQAPWKRLLVAGVHRVMLAGFEWRLRRIALGSAAWHRLQERLAQKSSAGFGQTMRNRFYSRTLRTCGPGLFVHPQVVIYYPENVTLGKDVFINRGVMFMAPVKITIGDNTLIGPYAMFNSSSHLYADRSILIDDQGHKYGEIVVSNDVWVGGHACILPGVTLGEGAVVGAGAVVTKSVAPYTVVAGVPARQIAVRGE